MATVAQLSNSNILSEECDYSCSLSLARPEVPGKLEDGPPLNQVPSLVKSATAEKWRVEGEVAITENVAA